MGSCRAEVAGSRAATGPLGRGEAARRGLGGWECLADGVTQKGKRRRISHPCPKCWNGVRVSLLAAEEPRLQVFRQPGCAALGSVLAVVGLQGPLA